MRRLTGSALLAFLLYAANPAAFATQRTNATEEHLVCKKPESPLCVTWQLVGVDPDVIIEESPVNATQFCGLSDLKRILPHRKFITVKSLESHGKPKIVFCKGFTKLKGKVVNWKQVVNALEALNRPRRQTGFVPRGRYRGQTQSQYLAIDRGNGKDEGKAEAHSAADSSRASVSGNSGMGQAQSQSIYDPSCDDCNGHEVESLKRGPPHVSGGGPLENRFGPDGGKIEWTGPGGRDGYGPPGSYGSMPGGRPPNGNNGYRPGQGISGHNQQGTPGGINGYGPRQGSNIGTNQPRIAGPGYYGSVPGVSNVYRPGPGINNGPTQVDSGGIPRPGPGHYGSVPGDINGYRPGQESNGQGQQGTVGLLGNGPNGPNGRYSPGDRQGGNNGYRPGEQLGGNQVSGTGTQYKPSSESAPGYGTDQGLPGSTYGSGPGYTPVQNGLNSRDGLRPGQNYGNVPGLNGQGIVPSRNGFNQGSNNAPNDGQLLIPGQNGGVLVPGKTYTSGQNGLPGVNYGSSQSMIPVGNLGYAPSQGPSTNNGGYVLGKNGMPGSYQTSPGSVNGLGLNNAGPGLGSYIPVQGNQIYGPGGTREPTNGANSNIPSSNWPQALGPFTGPPGSSVYCCVVPNNLGNGANIISPSGTYGGGQNAPGGVGSGQPPYGSVPGSVPNNLVGPAYGPSGPGGPNPQGSYNTVVSSGGPAGQVPYGPNHGGQNAIQGPGTYGTGTYGPGVVHGMSGPEIYGAGQRGGPGQQAGQTPGTLANQNEIPGTGTYGTRPGGSDVQNNVHGPGSYTPGSGLDRGGQNGVQGHGTYGTGLGTLGGQIGVQGPGIYGPGSTGGPSSQNGMQGPGTYGPGSTVVNGQNGIHGPGTYGPGSIGGPSRQNGMQGPGIYGQNGMHGTYSPGATGGPSEQNGVQGPGTYGPGSNGGPSGQNGMQGPGIYGPGSTRGPSGQNVMHGPGTYGPGVAGGLNGQNAIQGPGTYGPGATGGLNGQNSMPGTYGPGSTGGPSGQNGMQGPGSYGPGLNGGPSGQNGMQEPGTYGTGATGGPNGQNGMQGPGTYGPGATGGPNGQNGMQGPGTYGPGATGGPNGQNGMQGPGTYGTGATGGPNGQHGMQGPGTYGPGATGVPNGQNGMLGPGTYGPGATGGPNGQNGMQGPGTYGPGATGGPNGQNGMQGPGTYGTGATGGPNGQNGMQGPGTYSPGATVGPNGQNGMQGPGTYGPGATGGPNGQNGIQGPGTYGPGATGGPNGQNGMQGPGTYGPGATGGPNGQNGIQGPGTYGPGATGGPNGQNGMQGPGTYGPGATGGPKGQNGMQPGLFGTRPSSGTYLPGGQNGAQGSESYVPGGLGGVGGPHGMQGPGAYGPGDIGGEQNVAPGQYGNQNGPGGQPVGGGNSGVDQHSSLGNRFGFDSQGNPVHGNGSPQNFVDPNSIAIDGDDSEAEAIVNQALNGTTASASSKGGNDKGRAQTHVHGTYTGGGSFQAQAQITGENKEAESEVSGGKKGASSSATGSGRNNKSQASVQLGSETGSIQTNSQTTGAMHSSNSQVQGSVKGGMADAQARGPGSTSSQAQIGFTPYKDGDKEHELLKTPFVGGGVSSAQSSGRTGQSQSQLHGTFKYGITYNGAAQAGASLDKDAVFPNRLNFDKIDVFDETQKNINVNTDSLQIEYSSTESPVLLSAVPLETKSNVDNEEEITTTKASEETMKNSESRYSSHTHLDHHKTDPILEPTSSPVGTRRSFQSGYGNTSPDYEYTKDKDEPAPDEYDSDPRYSIDGPAYGVEENDATEVEQTEGEEYPNYDEYARDPLTHQSLLSPKKPLEVQQSTGGNTQHIVLGSLKGHDAEITQKNSAKPDETKVYQPGERVPGTGGYRIPMGFTGSVKSVASKENTYVVGTKHSPSQAQTVTLTPGTGKVSYVYPPSYGKYVSPKDLKSLKSRGSGNDDRYVSVSKSVTRALDGENNIRKQYSHTYYTKSSSCGYFTFTCTMVSGVDGRKKVCKPKMPTNPDGTPIRC